MSDWIDAQGYRANVGIVLMRDSGEVFLGQRTGKRGWQFPQGGVRQGEPVEQALYRELEEEIGLAKPQVTLVGSTVDWIRYKLPKRYVRRGRGPTCIGQKQRWFLLKLAVPEGSVEFKFTNTDEPEFDGWRWANYWDPVREVIYFKRPVYVRMLTELSAAAFPAGAPPLPDWWQAEATRGRRELIDKMPGLPPKLVVTTYAPTRRWITIVLLVLVVAGGVYGMFELGRYRAGFDVAAAFKQRAKLQSDLAAQETTISELRAQVAQLESSTVGQTREREKVQRTIGDLQAQVARANQELAFFRGIVTQNANSAEVKIQQARMVATATANKFRVRVTLVQPMKPDATVSGVVVLSVDGEVDGKPGRADFATLSGGKRREIPFTFRYLENIEEEITMPPGMKPEQLLVEVRSNRRGSAPVQQSYVWSVDPQ